MPNRLSPKTLERPFLRRWRRPHAAEVRPPKTMASTFNSFLWHAEEQKKRNNDNGAHYFFTSEQEQNQMFHICSCLLGISMRMCRQCFNAAQLTARERGWRPQHWAALAAPDVPPCRRNNRSGCPAFNKSHPVSFLCLPDTAGMLNPLKPTVMTPCIPSQRSNGFMLLLITNWWNNDA